MKCHLNRMTTALLVVAVVSIPALAAQAAPASELHATQEQSGGELAFDLPALWQRLLDGLSSIFAADGNGSGSGSDDGGEAQGGFDPDGFTLIPPDDGTHSTAQGSFDPDG